MELIILCLGVCVFVGTVPTLHSTVQLGLVLMAKGELEEAEAIAEAYGCELPQLGTPAPPELQ